MEAAHLLVLALKVAIVGTVFGYGLQAGPADLLHLARRPGLLLRSIFAVLVIMPAIVVTMVKLLDLRTATEAALVALAISPVPPLLPGKQSKAGGLPSYALGLLITLALVSVIGVPLAIELVAWIFDRPFAVQPLAIARIVLLMIVVPLVAGMALRFVAPRIAARAQAPLRWVSTAILAGAAVLLLGASWSSIWTAIGGGTIVALVAFVLCGLAVGHVLGGPEPEHSTVLALATASRHPAIALTIAAMNFPNEHFVGLILLYLLISALVCLPYVIWRRHRRSVE